MDAVTQGEQVPGDNGGINDVIRTDFNFVFITGGCRDRIEEDATGFRHGGVVAEQIGAGILEVLGMSVPRVVSRGKRLFLDIPTCPHGMGGNVL